LRPKKEEIDRHFLTPLFIEMDDFLADVKGQ
jgi:hypothetical protein